MTNLLKELEAVVGLQADFDNASGWEEEQTRGAIEDISAVNFLRTHHAEIAESLSDARRYRLLRNKARQNTAYDVYGNGGHWSVGFFSSDNRLSFDAAIDAMHNSAREVGE